MVWQLWVHVTTCQTPDCSQSPDCCRLIIGMIVPDCVNFFEDAIGRIASRDSFATFESDCYLTNTVHDLMMF